MKTETQPLVSIGMPVYNGEKYIRQALDSLLSQDFIDFELIISDNSSTDSTPQICKKYMKMDPRIRYYRNKKNIGAAANFDRLVYLAQGKYFMWAAYDDIWEPSFVSCLLGALEGNQAAVLAFCHFSGIDEYGQQTYVFNKGGKIFNYSRLWQIVHMISTSLGTPMWNNFYGLMRKDVLLKCGGMETRFGEYGAGDLTLFHLLTYGPFTIVNKLLFHKRLGRERHARKLSVSNVLEHLRRLSNHLRGNHKKHSAFRVLLKESPLRIDEKIVIFMTTIIMEPIEFLAVLKYYTVDTLLMRIENKRNNYIN